MTLVRDNVIKFQVDENGKSLTRDFPYNSFKGKTIQDYKDEILMTSVRKEADKAVRDATEGLLKDYVTAQSIVNLFGKMNFEKEFCDKMTKQVQAEVDNRLKRMSGTDNPFTLTQNTTWEKIQTEWKDSKAWQFSNRKSKTLVSVIQELEGLMKGAFGGIDFSKYYKDNQSISFGDACSFFKNLEGIFKAQPDIDKEIIHAVENISKRLGALKTAINKTNPNDTTAIEKIWTDKDTSVKNIAGSMRSIVGKDIFENITVNVIKPILEKYHGELLEWFNEEFETLALDKFSELKGLVDVKCEIRHTGGERVQKGESGRSGAQKIGDSTITFTTVWERKDSRGDVSCIIEVPFSTKFYTGHPRIKPTATGLKKHYGEDKAKDVVAGSSVELATLLKEVDLYDYWFEKLQPFLHQKSKKGHQAEAPHVYPIDNQYWIATKQRILTLHAYEALAKRAGGSAAQFMNINGSAADICNIISKYWDFIGKGSKAETFIKTWNKNRSFYNSNVITNHSIGFRTNIYTGYSTYYQQQWSESNDKEGNKEDLLRDTFNKHWTNLVEKKVSLGIDIVSVMNWLDK